MREEEIAEASLAELAASNNIRRACEAAGLSRNAIHARRRKDPHFAAAWAAVAVPLRIRLGGRALAFLSTVTTFGTALDITAAELSIEAFLPADPATAAALRG